MFCVVFLSGYSNIIGPRTLCDIFESLTRFVDAVVAIGRVCVSPEWQKLA